MPVIHKHDVVSSGQTLSDTTFYAGDTLDVQSGGIAYGITISSGGSESVEGVTSGDIISSGGSETLTVGAVTSDARIVAGGEVDGPGLLVGAVVDGLTSYVSFGSDTTVNNTSVFSGAIISDASVFFSGDKINGLTISGAGAIADIGGSADTVDDLVVGSGGTAGIDDLASLTTATVSSGGVLYIAGGSATDVTVSGGGRYFVTGGASDTSATILSGAVAYVSTSGVASGSLDSGREIVSSGGLILGAEVFGGGVLSIGDGGMDSGSLLVGGAEVVLSGGFDSVTTFLPGTTLTLVSGGRATGDEIASGATLDLVSMTISSDPYILSGPGAASVISGVALDAGALVNLEQPTVEADGFLSLTSGTNAVGMLVSLGGAVFGPGDIRGGGTDATLDYGLISGVNLIGQLTVESLGLASGIRAIGEDSVVLVVSGGLTVAVDELAAGDQVEVNFGGTAVSGVIRSGADAAIYGSARATHISNGGVEAVESGGLVSAAIVSSGGALSLFTSGYAEQATVLAGGALVDGSIALWSGGLTDTLAGTLSGAGEVIEDGPGTLIIGGVTSHYTGEAVISAGTIEVTTAMGLGGGDVLFTKPASRQTFKIGSADTPASGATYATTLKNFYSTSAFIDLAGVAFVSGAKATISGDILTLTDGSYKASFTLSGVAANKYAAFTDGAGGTEIRAELGSMTAPLLVDAMAAFDPGRAAAPTSAANTDSVAQPMRLVAATAERGVGVWG